MSEDTACLIMFSAFSAKESFEAKDFTQKPGVTTQSLSETIIQRGNSSYPFQSKNISILTDLKHGIISSALNYCKTLILLKYF